MLSCGLVVMELVKTPPIIEGINQLFFHNDTQQAFKNEIFAYLVHNYIQ
jgi:hypothetical protein